jgi:hypothetical protein
LSEDELDEDQEGDKNRTQKMVGVSHTDQRKDTLNRMKRCGSPNLGSKTGQDQ